MNTGLMSHPGLEMRRLQGEMERLFASLAPVWRAPLAIEYPPLNLTRDEQGVTIEALCPGVDRDTLDVTLISDALTIRGERKLPAGVANDAYHRRERTLGAFTRVVTVGDHFDPDRVQATYTNGLLRVQLTRAPEAAPKKIPIRN